MSRQVFKEVARSSFNSMYRLLLVVLVSVTLVSVSACGWKQARVVGDEDSSAATNSSQAGQSPGANGEYGVQQGKSEFSAETLNRRLQEVSVGTNAALYDYTIGPGDILELAVFQVDELSRRVRVNGRGKIMLPLLGEIQAAGKSAAEIESELAQLLGARYLQNPQVSVFVSEYRSQQITVMGAVNQPMVHSVQQPRTLLEVISMSGGLTSSASKQIHVKTNRLGEGGKPYQENFVVDLLAMIDSGDVSSNMVLQSGDTVFVPQAGVVFVEGYVKKPGAYAMNGKVNVLKAVALAGGIQDIANQKAVQVLRQDLAGATSVIEVDLESVRDNGTTDLALEDGDIVVVQANGIKKTWSGFWKGLSGIFGVGYGL